MGDIGKELEVVVQAMPIFIHLSSLKWVDLVDLDRLDVKKFGSPLVPYICIYICIYIYIYKGSITSYFRVLGCSTGSEAASRHPAVEGVCGFGRRICTEMVLRSL